MKNSQFRNFVYNKWMEHKDEIFEWTHKLPEYDADYYFRQHRWLLRAMYKEHLMDEHIIRMAEMYEDGIGEGQVR